MQKFEYRGKVTTHLFFGSGDGMDMRLQSCSKNKFPRDRVSIVTKDGELYSNVFFVDANKYGVEHYTTEDPDCGEIIFTTFDRIDVFTHKSI